MSRAQRTTVRRQDDRTRHRWERPPAASDGALAWDAASPALQRTAAGLIAPTSAGILALQRVVGNRTVWRLLAGRFPTGPAHPPAARGVAVQRFTDDDVKTRAYYIWKNKGEPQQDRAAQEADYFRARQELEAQAVALVASLDGFKDDRKRHIMAEKHHWERAVADAARYRHAVEKTSFLDPPSWLQVKAVMAQVLRDGKLTSYKGTAQQAQLAVNGHQVVVTLFGTKVSDGWVIT